MPLKRVRIGSRSDNRVFNFDGSWSPHEIDRITEQIRAVFSYFGGWTEAANQIADSLKDRTNPVPIPTTLIKQAELFPSGWVHPLGLEDGLRQALPSINWASDVDQQRLAQFKQQELIKLQSAADQIARVDNRPAQTVIPTGGTLHEALRRYDEYAKEEQPLNHDRHAKIKQLIERSDDVPLAILNISACRNLIDYWRNRPPRHDGNGNYSAKRSREQLAELDLFFRHTHANNDFAWRMPEDLQLLKRTISKDEKKNLSYIPQELFSVTELKKLVSTGSTVQRLIATWCLNCAHGAAEIGRVTWGDIYLNQDHPWRSQGLQVDSGGNWTGFLRHKTEVVGWWHLWPETVALLQQWKNEAEQILQRPPKTDDRMILTQDGLPMYKDKSKNGQSKFAKVFEEHRELASVSNGTSGTLT